MAPEHVEARVARGADGTILIAAGPGLRDIEAYGDVVAVGPDFTRAVLDVAGAVLTWAVLDEPVLPSAEIHDVGRAQQWVWALYGEGVAAAVHDCAAGRTDVQVTAEVTAPQGAAARLGLGHWATRWWPASYSDGIPALEPDLLGLESAALTHRCQQLFDDGGDQPDDCAAELIEEHGAALDPLIQWWREAGRASDTGRRLESVLRLLDDAADSAGIDGPALRHLRSALEGHGPAGTAAGSGTPFSRRAGYTLAAGETAVAGGRVIARGSGVNDWCRYPPGFVDAAEDAVSWTARALGARRLTEVEALAELSAPATGTSLVAEVRVNGGDPHRAPLTRRDDLWTGYADLSPDLSAALRTPRVEVGVLLPGFDPGPGTPSSPDGRAERDAVRALVRRRLTTAARPPANDANPNDGFPAPFLAETAAADSATDEDY
ncbi:hypothetical protein GCM10009540_19310 [Streptomyces turgidiscabies]|uniref:hypothetical protein n=1 Tax=Streptomyces turgidiscabies TaxID=85558 RepID=UPI002FEB767A